MILFARDELKLPFPWLVSEAMACTIHALMGVPLKTVYRVDPDKVVGLIQPRRIANLGITLEAWT